MSKLFIRVKGRVQGPFPIEKLQGLARRGQLSRIHHVSEDGENWRKASEFPDLFSPPRPAAPREIERTTQRSGEGTATVAARSDEGGTAPSAPEESAWFLEDSGKPKGPMSFGALKKHFQSGEYAPSTLVWRDGMEDWVAADTIEGLMGSASSRMFQVNDRSRQENNRLDPGVIETLAESRGWVVTCAVILWIWCILWVIGAFVMFVQAVKASFDTGIVVSLIAAAFGIVLGCLASLVMQYSSSLVRLRIDRDALSLQHAHKRLGRIWVCCGIILLVIAALFVISFILEVAGVSDGPIEW